MKKFNFKQTEYVAASHEDQMKPNVWKKVMFKKEDYHPDGKLQMINWAKLPAGNTFNAHYHEDMEETFIILDGTVEFEINGEKFSMSKGDAVIVPTKGIHKMTNNLKRDVEYIVVGVAQGKNGKTINV